MSAKRYVVELTVDERARLQALIGKGKAPAAALLKARMLLKADRGASGPDWTDARIAEALESYEAKVHAVRKTFVEEGLDAVLARKKRLTPPIAPMFDGEKQARLIKLACSAPPQGRGRWTLELLAEKAVELKIVAKTSDDTVRLALKKTGFNLI